MSYDANNIFARILRGELPCKKQYEDEYVFAFHDINPLAPVHVLIIPKGAYVSIDDFATQASAAEAVAMFAAVQKIAADLGVTDSGYRVLTNCGRDGHQEVPHFHMHLLAGRPLGSMLPKRD